MRTLRRIHPFDLAAAAVFLAAVVYLLVSMSGYRYRGTAKTGFLRELPVTLTLVVRDPLLRGLVSEFTPGPITVETGRGPGQIELLTIETDPVDSSLRLRVAVKAEVDATGRAFWNELRLRRGERFAFGDARRNITALIAEVEGLEAPAP